MQLINHSVGKTDIQIDFHLSVAKGFVTVLSNHPINHHFRAVMMRINAARKSILADNSEQFRTIQREKNPSSRKQVPRSKKQIKNVESFETELLDEIVKFSEKETLSLEACQHIATKLQTTNYLEVADIQNMLFSWEFFQKLFSKSGAKKIKLPHA